MSIILKILETRFLPKLNRYLTRGILPSQVGFVPRQGVMTNIYRAVRQITARTKQKRKVFALFIDLKAAYNHVPHELLFERLRKVLTEEEVKFEEAIYSRIMLSHGRHSFRPNVGVAQGSTTSPAFFDIYLDPLLRYIASQLNISVEDILAYADDIMILVDNIKQLQRLVQLIDSTFPAFNLHINKQKSGIVQFRHRRSKLSDEDIQWREKHHNVFLGYPIVPEYRYLGTLLTEKLTIDSQLAAIAKKSRFIASKLFPALHNSTLSYRYNMWQIFIAPLFDFILPLISVEFYASPVQRAELLLRKTLRQFTFLHNNVSINTFHNLFNYHLRDRAKLLEYISHQKWLARLQGRHYYPTRDLHFSELSEQCTHPNRCKLLPSQFVTLTNTLTTICPVCRLNNDTKIICTQQHLKQKHRLEIDGPNEIIQLAEQIREDEKTRKKEGRTILTRSQMIGILQDKCLESIRRVKIFLGQR